LSFSMTGSLGSSVRGGLLVRSVSVAVCKGVYCRDFEFLGLVFDADDLLGEKASELDHTKPKSTHFFTYNILSLWVFVFMPIGCDHERVHDHVVGDLEDDVFWFNQDFTGILWLASTSLIWLLMSRMYRYVADNVSTLLGSGTKYTKLINNLLRTARSTQVLLICWDCIDYWFLVLIHTTVWWFKFNSWTGITTVPVLVRTGPVPVLQVHRTLHKISKIVSSSPTWSD
jgi:hypothetical protein